MNSEHCAAVYGRDGDSGDDNHDLFLKLHHSFNAHAFFSRFLKSICPQTHPLTVTFLPTYCLTSITFSAKAKPLSGFQTGLEVKGLISVLLCNTQKYDFRKKILLSKNMMTSLK